MVSPEAFADELDLKLTAYPYDIKNQPLAYNSMVLDLVSILTDETVILARAKEKKIFLSEEDVALAESEFKKDYPQDSFEQMLLENAIPYPVWRNRLEKDMVIDKIVQLELVDVQEISPEDMVAFYSRIAGQPEDERHALDEAGLVKQLRMEKSQAFYDEWISGLKIKYPVEINQKALAVFLMKQE
ncbi:MAG: hypothetical protein HUK40_20780 [Desulfobacter sp.]|nr:hypothetical protein [Desulfobacter sp.]WDP86642.1 MAG: hypothetical protein HUN05_17185 [Desulfobacter sp.]